MLLSMIRFLRGYIKIRVSGYSPERFLNACSHKGICLWGLKPVRGAYEMYTDARSLKKMKAVLKKTGTKAEITGRYGLPFFLHRYRKRKVFFAGIFFCAALIYIFSLFIWEIDIEGNLRRTDEAILSFLDSEDVRHGMPVSKVDCSRIASRIREEYSDIIWVSASIQGAKLVIQVKENEDLLQEEPSADSEEKAEDSKKGTDLVADRDCTIVSIVTRNGIPAVKAGSKVKKGDILVSGRVEMKNDAGEVTGYRYREADADIKGEYIQQYENTAEREYPVKDYIKERNQPVKKSQWYLRIGPWTASLGSIENKYENCEYRAWEKDLKLGDSFILPVSFGEREVVPYKTHRESLTDEEIQQDLSRAFAFWCEELEKKGVEIIRNDVKIYTEQKKASAKGSVTLQREVAEKRDTEILPDPERETLETERENQNGND